jgi:hypothetical protein
VACGDDDDGRGGDGGSGNGNGNDVGITYTVSYNAMGAIGTPPPNKQWNTYRNLRIKFHSYKIYDGYL